MHADLWKKVDELFRAAQAQPLDQRAEFLKQACPDDLQIRAEVESLLHAAPEAASFLDSSPLSSALTPGSKLGHFEILGSLGRGGMGEVYRARDLRLKREVAIKVLPVSFARDPDRIARFEREARAASALNHPNIVTLHDVGSESGVDFLVMEYVPGKTLDKLIPRKGLPLNEALQYAIEIAGALAKAHAAGIIHRDLKPGNIMVTDGMVKVLDFGLAKLAETAESGDSSATTPLTSTTMIVGTAAYMSPEQAQGRPVDARSDIFSFGVMLYEMLTGQRPFQGANRVSTLAAILQQEPTPLTDIGAKIPHELERVVLRCLRKEPDRRFQNMADLKVSLADLKEESASDRLVIAGEKTSVGLHRPALVWMAAFAAIVVGSAVFWFLTTRTASSESAPRLVPLTAYPGIVDRPSFSPDGNQVAFAWKGEKKDNFDIYVKLIDSATPLRLTTDPVNHFYPTWSPDGRSIAFQRNTGNTSTVILIPAIGGPEREIGRLSGCSKMSWTPDGKWLAVMDGAIADQPSSLFLLSPATGEKIRLTSPPSGTLGDYDPDFSPDGRKLAFCRSRSLLTGEIYVLSLSKDLVPQGEPIQLTRENVGLGGPVWTHDGRQIICEMALSENSTLWRLSASGGAPQQLGIAGEGSAPAISRTGSRLAYSRQVLDPNIWRVQLPGSGAAEPSSVPIISSSRSEESAEYSPDGKQIAFSSDRSGNWEIWVCNSDGSNAVQVTSLGKAGSGSPHWSPDGRRIVFDWNVTGHWDIYTVNAKGGGLQRMTTDSFDHNVPIYSRDGKYLYFCSLRTGRLDIWKMPAEGGNAVQVTKNGGMVGLESMDGKSLYYISSDVSPLWKMPVTGGEATQVVPAVQLRAFAITEHGIYFIPPPKPGGRSSIEFLGFDARRAKTVLPLTHPSYIGLSVSPDNHFLLYSQWDQITSDLILLEHFR